MKNFKKIALATLAALTTLAPNANAKFEDKHGNVFYEPTDFPTHAALVEQLYEIGVPVVDGKGTNLCADEDTLGWYTPDRNFMVICNGDYNLRAETLTHEAVHVVQDCRAGFNNVEMDDPSIDKLRALAKQLGRDTVEWIVEVYKEDQVPTEIEAFYFETRPAAVERGLHTECGAPLGF